MKILNLYSGIGGNRKLWPNGHDVTAIEINHEIAKIYQEFFPQVAEYFAERIKLMEIRKWN